MHDKRLSKKGIRRRLKVFLSQIPEKNCSIKRPGLVLLEVILKSTKLWIVDSEVSYAEAFREYVNLKKGHLFQVRTCTEKEQLRKAFAGKEIEILLITAQWYQFCKDLIRNECVIFLSEGSLPVELSMYSAVYKYQSVENILREILYFYSEQDMEEEYLTQAQRDHKVIGVFSPVNTVEKNKFALALGQILAEDQNVLYLNLEECSGLSEIFTGNHWNLSDLIYYLRQSTFERLIIKINEFWLILAIFWIVQYAKNDIKISQLVTRW